MTGKIIKKSQDAVVVEVERVKRHRLYGKQYRVTKKFTAANPKNIGEVGNMLEFVKIKPVSKTKHWMASRIVKE